MEQEVLNGVVEEATETVVPEVAKKVVLTKTDVAIIALFGVGTVVTAKAAYKGCKKLFGKAKELFAKKEDDGIIDGEFTEVEETTEE